MKRRQIILTLTSRNRVGIDLVNLSQPDDSLVVRSALEYALEYVTGVVRDQMVEVVRQRAGEVDSYGEQSQDR